MEGNGPDRDCTEDSTGALGVIPTAKSQPWRNISGALSLAKAQGTGRGTRGEGARGAETRPWLLLSRTPGGDTCLDGLRPAQ